MAEQETAKQTTKEPQKAVYAKIVSIAKRSGFAGVLTLCKVEVIGEETTTGEDKGRGNFKFIKGPVHVGDIIELK